MERDAHHAPVVAALSLLWSAVAIDPWTGAIKAIVSYPTFNEKLASDNPKYLAQLYKETHTTPTLNRAMNDENPGAVTGAWRC